MAYGDCGFSVRDGHGHKDSKQRIEPMKHLRHRGLWGWAAALVIALAWGAQGAPIMPMPRVDLPEEVQSLAGIDRVQLTMADLPESLTKRGLKKAEVRRRCIDRLARDGIHVVDDPALPRMDLWFEQVDDPDQPDSSCFVSVIAVYQSVRVNRLNRDMTVPTACFASATLTTKGKPVEEAARQLVRRCGNVARVIALAKRPG